MAFKNFTESSQKRRAVHRPLRMCVGCRQREESRLLASVHCITTANCGKAEIVFNARYADSDIKVSGRGAWLHYDVTCFNKAIKRNAFSLSFKAQERKIDFLCPAITDFESTVMIRKAGGQRMRAR